MAPNNRVVELINKAIANRQQVGINTEEWCVRPHKFAESGRRGYIGASQLGGKCRRQRWYEFHWIIPQSQWDPRLLRLFDRGHREEERMAGYLRLIDCEVEEFDPESVPSLWYTERFDQYYALLPHQIDEQVLRECLDVSGTFHEWVARGRGVEIPEPRQFHYVDFDGHHGGHTDGRARNIPDHHLWGLTADDWALTEYKTHNEKSFNELVAIGVYQSKYGHYAQVQRYMQKMDLPLCVYMAVNKNNDDLYCEYIPLNPGYEAYLNMHAHEAIYSPKPPPRLSNSPSWFECRWCDARPQCHYGAPHDKNCHSCSESSPVANGNWFCNRWQKVIPKDFEPIGCEWWHQRDD